MPVVHFEERVKRTVKRNQPSAANRGARRAPRGQAMVEYSIISHALLLGGGVAMLPIVIRLINALSTYFASVYFVLSTGAL